jgi:hypothetical protein
VVSVTPRPLYSGKTPRYPINMRLGGPQRRSGHFGEEKNLLSLPRLELRVRAVPEGFISSLYLYDCRYIPKYLIGL